MYERLTLSLEDARVAMNAMLDATKRVCKRSVVIAIVDHRGGLMHYARQDEGFVFSSDVAIRKAYTAAMGRLESSAFSATYAKYGRTLEDAVGPQASSGTGGVPILTTEGVCLGGIGVSGDSFDGDVAIGRIGVEAMGLKWKI